MAFKRITDKRKLALLANDIRADIVKSLHAAGSGHPGGSLGMTDVYTILYFYALNHNPKKPEWKDRDRVVLSNGHICPVLYCTMAHAGYWDIKEVMTLRKMGSRFQGHPHRTDLPGVETSSGPLGSGLSQAVGMALAGEMDDAEYTVYAMTSDGEHQEGNHWEAVMLAGKHKLSNLIQIMDRNYIQIDGRTEQVMPLDPVREKYEAFGWYVIEVDGHNYDQVMEAMDEAKKVRKQPVLINALTVPGKGVSFMEDDHHWHGKTPNDEELETALADLAHVREMIEQYKYEY